MKLRELTRPAIKPIYRPSISMHNTIAAVDLGSNSFRLQVARIAGGQIYPLDSLKETVRLAGGLTDDKTLNESSQERALACLTRFGERLRGLPAEAVRVVGTNTLRVAKNSGEFIRKAQRRLGFPIDVVAGHEEARLVYLGVAHTLPAADAPRLVVDIGGGSTELIIGKGMAPVRLESLYMGCVSMSARFFGEGKLSSRRFEQAELAAATELQTMSKAFRRKEWEQAVGSSGTARALAEILQQNGWSDGGISAGGLNRLRKALIKAGEVRKLDLAGLRDDRKPVLAGGFAIMAAVFAELELEDMHATDSGLREGVLWDMLGRLQHHDVREATVDEFVLRYQVDRTQSTRVAQTAAALYRELTDKKKHDAGTERLLAWAARLHEIGLSIAYSGFHRHSAYILEHADIPGFSKGEQTRMAHLVLGARGSLAKVAIKAGEEDDWLAILALRLAVLFHRGRNDVKLPPAERQNTTLAFTLDGAWMKRNPLVVEALRAEVKNWKNVGFHLELRADEEGELQALTDAS